jgi:hypothetical protein
MFKAGVYCMYEYKKYIQYTVNPFPPLPSGWRKITGRFICGDGCEKRVAIKEKVKEKRRQRKDKR